MNSKTNLSISINELNKMFYDELNTQLKNDTKKNESLKENNMCLLSHEKLNDNNIKLQCNHSFNEYPLFKEIFSQKKTI